MGVYINGIEMPNDCLPVKLQIWPDGQVDVFENGEYWSVGKAVHVPPHGRLIDADELCSALWKRSREFSNYELGYGIKRGLADARVYIKIAPTIIPADEGEI